MRFNSIEEAHLPSGEIIKVGDYVIESRGDNSFGKVESLDEIDGTILIMYETPHGTENVDNDCAYSNLSEKISEEEFLQYCMEE
jgi:hypothetical protein